MASSERSSGRALSIAKLMLRDPDGEFGAVFRTRAFEACFEFVYGFVFGRAVGGGEGEEKHVKGKSAHGSQCFFDSIQTRRCRAFHSSLGYLPLAESRKR